MIQVLQQMMNDFTAERRKSVSSERLKRYSFIQFHSEVLGVSEITANLYCNCVHLYWEGCAIISIYIYIKHSVYMMQNTLMVGGGEIEMYNIYPWFDSYLIWLGFLLRWCYITWPFFVIQTEAETTIFFHEHQMSIYLE